MSLRENFLVFLKSLDVDAVLPVMFSEGILTAAEYERFRNPALSRQTRCDLLLRSLPNKGRNFYQRFCICVAKAGQVELVRSTGFDMSLISETTPISHPPSQTGIPPTQIGTPPIQINQPTSHHTGTPTQKLLVLYSNDSHLQSCPSLPPENRRSPAEYLREVADFVGTLQMFSTVPGEGGRASVQAYTCIYDVEESQRAHISNFVLWSERHLEECDAVLLLCSPQLGAVLRGESLTLEMERGQANAHSLANALPRKRVLPIFLNMPKVTEWLPGFLRSTPCYEVHLTCLQRGVGQVTGLEEFSRRAYTLLDEDPNLKDLSELLRLLRRESIPPGPGPGIPVPPPKPPPVSAKYIEFVVSQVYFIWEKLATRLGLEFFQVEFIRMECQQNRIKATQMMFAKWQEEKGHEANMDSLIQALTELEFLAVVYKLKEMQKNKK